MLSFLTPSTKSFSHINSDDSPTSKGIFHDIPIPKFCEAINAEDAHALSLAPLVQNLNLYKWSISDSMSMSYKNRSKSHKWRLLIPKSHKTGYGRLYYLASMEQLGNLKLVQLQSLHTRRCLGTPVVDAECEGRHHMLPSPIYSPCTRSKFNARMIQTSSTANWLVSQ